MTSPNNVIFNPVPENAYGSAFERIFFPESSDRTSEQAKASETVRMTVENETKRQTHRHLYVVLAANSCQPGKKLWNVCFIPPVFITKAV